ncbi:class I SAM-dependent methyltransferase [Cupriavidus basilensis]|uniref:Class I SAM-dependent methyltransferase n=1 Tax=Cupriavidus basilensis TaxID=68895 RepID=A0ABT6B4Q4_9BURK|nr:class I SAM-dependent methyltransferase [Cupriavidus basilensis]MDF3839867.1 class I SAM-dependent methyltransferase [Cupriavidus basilensis]
MQSHSATNKPHSHMWLVGIAGLAAGLALMVYVPSLKAVSQSLFWFAAFHLIGGVVLLGSLYAAVGRRLRQRPHIVDFGWAPAWTLGPLLAAIVFLAAAVALQIAMPGWWPCSIVLTFLSANAFAGHLAATSAARPDHAPLPLVDLLPGGRGLVLDGGCGAGRTSIAVARGVCGASIVALDRFDSDYIEEGGRALLMRNLNLARIEDRVHVQQGDLTDLPFSDASFDATVSAHAIDHLGDAKTAAMREMWRVLKPGGRFLLVVWVRGWSMFAIANVLSFALATRGSWRTLALRSGFDIQLDGSFNGHFFLLLSKPAGSAPLEDPLLPSSGI